VQVSWSYAVCRAHLVELLTRHPDLLINICLTLLGYIPGHIHAFYLLFVYYDRREQMHHGNTAMRRAPGVYSERVQTGGVGYGTMAQPIR
jgi:hypothetical protein